jgi:hypothetical protein
MPKADGDKDKGIFSIKLLLLGGLGFILDFTTYFSIVLSYSVFLKRIGIAYLPYYYITLNVLAIIIGVILFVRNFSSFRILLVMDVILAGIFIGTSSILGMGSPGIVFTLYFLSALSYIYSLMFYWNFISHTLTIRQLKKYSGFFAGMNLLGMIAAGSLMKPLMSSMSVSGCYLTVGFLYGMTALILSLIPPSGEQAGEGGGDPVRLLSSVLGKSELVKFMILSTIAVGVVKYMVDYQFGSTLSLKFGDEKSLAGFYGLFNAVNTSSILFFQVFLLHRFLRGISLDYLYKGAGFVFIAMSIAAINFPSFSIIVIFQFLSIFFIKALIQPILNVLIKTVPRSDRARVRFLVDGITYSCTVVSMGLVILTLNRFKMPAPAFFILAGISGGLIMALAGRINGAYLSSLLENLRKGTESTRDSAEEDEEVVPEYQGEGNIPVLSSPGGYPAPAVKDLFCSKEGEIGRKLKILSGPGGDPAVAAALVRLSGSCGSPQARGGLTPYLREALTSAVDPSIILPLIEALARQGDGESLPMILSHVKNPDPQVKACAVLSTIKLSGRRDHLEQAMQELAAMTRSKDARLRSLSLPVMGELCQECFVPAVRQLLGDPEEDVRKRAVDASLRLRAPALLQDLWEMLDREENRGIRPDVERVMSSLQDEAYSEMLLLTRGLDIAHKGVISRCLPRLRGGLLLRTALKSFSVLPQAAAVGIAEILSNLPPGGGDVLLFDQCFHKDGFSLYPLLAGMVESRGLEGLPLKIVDEIARGGGEGIILKDLSILAGKYPAESLDRERAAVFFQIAGLCGLGRENGQLLFQNITSGDPGKEDIAREVLDSSERQGRPVRFLQDLARKLAGGED